MVRRDRYPRVGRRAARARLMAVAVASCYATAPAWAVGPADFAAIIGSWTASQSGNTTTLTTDTERTLAEIRKHLNLPADQTLLIQQPSASSVFFLRAVPDAGGVLQKSIIDGTIWSNGQFWHQNSAGMLIGRGAVIDTAGFLATNMAVRMEDFMAARLTSLQNIGGSGGIVNQGTITTHSGGSVYLIGDNVKNESGGVIKTPGGETILAAGQTVNLIDTGTPGVKVEITGAEGNATNLGEIVATAGRIGMAGVIVRNSGTLNASSVVSEGGRVFLKASKDAYVDGAGRIVAAGTKGGKVEVLGERVAVMDQAQIDVSGISGGGTVLVGGDYQGKNPDVKNATVTYFGKDASIKADATDNGDGGKVILWADDTTRAYGNISARGGANGGNGGFVETSGHNYLDINGIRGVDTRAPNGALGKWLLDPTDITLIAGAGTDTYGGGTFAGDPLLLSGGGATSTIYSANIKTYLATSNVELTTGSGGTGNITFTAGSYDFSPTNGATSSLSLLAYGGAGSSGAISLPAGTNITMLYGGLTMIAGWDGAGTTSADVVTGAGRNIDVVQSTVTAKSINLFAGNNITLNGSGGDTTVESTGSGTQNVTAGGIVDLTAGSGKALLKAGTGSQTVTAAKVQLQGSNTTSNAFASIGANGGAQTVKASASADDAIKITAGTVSGAYADIYQSGSGSQTVEATNGGIALYGGASFAQIRSDSTTAFQTIFAKTVLEMRGAANYSNGSAMIHSAYGQSVTAKQISLYGGGAIASVYGSAATISAYGDQTITAAYGGAGGIYLVGGGFDGSVASSYGGLTNDGGYNNQATIRHGQYGGSGTTGNQTIILENSGTINAIGGTGDGWGGYTSNDCTSDCKKSSNEAGIDNHLGTQTIEFQAAGGTIALTGGTNGMGNSARIESDGQQMIRGSVAANAPTITLIGGASGGGVGTRTVTASNPDPYEYKFNSAEISADTSQTIYGATISLTGGAADFGGAIIGGGSGTSYIYASGNVQLTGGTGATGSGNSAILGSVAAIGSEKAYSGVLNIDGSLSMVGGASLGNRALIGSLYGTANVTVNAYGGMTIGGGATSANAPASIGSLNNSGGTVTLYGGYSATKGFATTSGAGAVTLSAGSQIVGVTTANIYSYAGGITQGASNISWIAANTLTARAGGSTMDVDLYADNRSSNVTLSADDYIHYNSVVPVTITSAASNSSSGAASGVYITSSEVGYGSSITLGTLSADGTVNDGVVSVTSAQRILDGNGSGTGNIVAKSISLTSTNGGTDSSGLAISADVGLVTGGTSIAATVQGTATYGGISIRNGSSVVPTSVALDDNSTYAGSGNVFYSSTYDINMTSTAFSLSSDYGPVTIWSGGFLTLDSPGEFSPGILANSTYGYVNAWGETGVATGANMNFATAIDLYIGTGGTMTIGHDIANVRNIGLYAAGSMNFLSGSSIIANSNAYLGGAAASLVGKTVSGTYGGGAITMTNSSVRAVSGTVAAYSGGDIRLNDGSYLRGGQGVNLALGGSASTLYLNDSTSYANPSYVLADTGMINIAMPGRSAEGVVIGGTATDTSTAYGSGLFVGTHGTPAVKDSNLKIVYGLAATQAITAVVAEVVKSVSTTTTSTSDDSSSSTGGGTLAPLLPPSGGGTSSLASLATGTVGGGSGEFGSTDTTTATTSTTTTTSTTSTSSGTSSSGESSTSGSTSGSTESGGTSSSGDQTAGSKEAAKEEKKDEKKEDKKDDKSKKADSSDKKDDKTKQKPVGKCSA